MHEEFERIYRFGTPEQQQQRFAYGNLFARELRKDTPLLRIAADKNQIDLLKLLLDKMQEPFWLLYVLLVPRADEGASGRYQSENVLTKSEVLDFLERFEVFLESDGRQSLWIKSSKGPDLLVYDRHNLIFAYGPIDEWAQRLQNLGWNEVTDENLRIPDPHMHYYHELFDDDARRLLKDFNWVHSPLRESDGY